MSAGPILALHAAPSWTGEDSLEFLRVVAALVACGHDVALAEVEPVFAGDDLPDEAERILEHVAALGVSPRRLEPADVAASRAILRLGAPDRSGEPPVWVSGAAGVEALLSAGQVIEDPA